MATWRQGYGYDERGNLLVTSEQGLGSSPQRPSAYTAGNRIGTAGYDYDGRGNLKQAPTLAGDYEKMVYDGEERQAGYCYRIAAEGVRRVLNGHLYCVSQGGGNDDRLNHHRA